MPMTTVLHVSLLGGFRLSLAGSPVQAALSTRQQALLAFIFLKAGFPISRTELAFLFWPDTSEAQAHANLRNMLHRLRKLLGWLDEFIDFEGRSLTWKPGQSVRVDVLEFEQAAGTARHLDALRQAAQLYRGDFLPACYEAWALERREQLRRRFQGLLDQLAGALEDAGLDGEALQVAHQLVGEAPLEETSYRTLMRLQGRRGDLAAIFSTYKTCVDRLGHELGVAPSEATQALLEQLAGAHPNPARPGTGEKRPASRKGNLPTPLSGLIGRQAELAEILQRLAQGRLVTLTGFGGIGKTRLALAAAHALAGQYPDGAWWLDLAPIAEPAQLAISLAETLGLAVQSEASLPDQLVDFIASRQLLLVADNCEHLLGALVPLINRLVQGCPNLRILATSRVSLGLSLQAAPGEQVLAIQPLPVPAQGASWSERSILESNPSIQLFLERARGARHNLQLDRENVSSIVEICRRLDGLPLAIEMAAARIRLLAPQQLADRLDDALGVLGAGVAAAPYRHQSMQSVLAWSYGLLSPGEQRHLRRLAVFAGSFDLPAFQPICAGDLPAAGNLPAALDGLAALVDHSLVAVQFSGGTARYRLHELTRQFCLEKLRQAGELEALSACHLTYFSHLAAEANAHLHDEEQVDRLRSLDAESDNFLAALHWACGQASPEPVRQALGLVGALWFYWFYRGRYVEGLQWTERTLQAAQSLDLPAGEQVGALNGAASFTFFMGSFSASARYASACRAAALQAGDLDGVILADHHLGMLAFHGAVPGPAGPYLEEGLALARKQEQGWLVALLLNDLGNAAIEASDWETAGRLFLEDLEISRQGSDFFAIYYALLNLCSIRTIQKDLVGAQAYNQEAMRMAEIAGDGRAAGLSWLHTGQIETLAGNHATAKEAYRQALQQLWDIRDRENTLECLEGLAGCFLHREQYERAARLLSTASAWRGRLQMQLLPGAQAAIAAHCDHLRQQMGESVFQAAWNSGAWLSLEEAVHSVEAP